MGELTRIARDPKVMASKVCIRVMRVTVGMVAGHIAEGQVVEAGTTPTPGPFPQGGGE